MILCASLTIIMAMWLQVYTVTSTIPPRVYPTVLLVGIIYIYYVFCLHSDHTRGCVVAGVVAGVLLPH